MTFTEPQIQTGKERALHTVMLGLRWWGVASNGGLTDISRHGGGLLAEGHVYSAWSLVMVFLPVVMFTVVTGYGLMCCRVGDCHRRRRCFGFSVHHGGGVCHAFSLWWLHVVVLVIMVVDCHYVLVAVMVGYYGGWSYWLA